MNINYKLIISLILVVLLLIIVGLLLRIILYPLIFKSEKRKIYNEIPPGAIIPSQWWGYGWRPWWRKYNGVPGFEK
jgi:hypothetical protein